MAKGDEDRAQEQAEAEIKIIDRRLFTIDGEPRRGLDEHDEEQPGTKEDAPAETATRAAGESEPRGQAGEGFEHRSVEEPEGVDFTMLINAMAQPALLFLGEIPHPGMGEAQVDLEQAKIQIDMLELLRVKCRGNMTRDEEGLLDRMLYQLRMLFVACSNQPRP